MDIRLEETKFIFSVKILFLKDIPPRRRDCQPLNSPPSANWRRRIIKRLVNLRLYAWEVRIYVMKNFLIAILTLAILGGVGFGVYYFTRPAAPGIVLEFNKPEKIYVGSPFDVTISYTNTSDQALKDAKLSVFLPDGLVFAGRSVDQRGYDYSVGDIGPGSVNQEKISLIATEGPQSFKKLSAKIAYSLASAQGAQFEANSSADLGIGPEAITLNVSLPKSAANGETFDVVFKYQNNLPSEFKGLRLKISYPPAFSISEVLRDDMQSNQELILASVSALSSGEIKVTGSLVGNESSNQEFKIDSFSNYDGQDFQITSQAANMSISSSPLTSRVTVNDSDANLYVAKIGDNLKYRVYYKNNSAVALANVRVYVGLIGEMFDFSRLNTRGSFSSLSNSILWTQQTNPELLVLAPGEERNVEFAITAKNNFNISRMSDRNYSLKLNIQMESPTVPPDVVAVKTVSVGQAETKIAGILKLDSFGLFYDPDAGFINSGPYPPKVNQSTQYTIHLRLYSYAVDMADIIVTGKLASGVKFTGKVKTNTDSEPTVDQNTGVVTWKLNNLSAGRGVINDPAEAIFQVEYTPSSLDAGRTVELVGSLTAEARDQFTGTALVSGGDRIDTGLNRDNMIKSTSRAIQQ